MVVCSWENHHGPFSMAMLNNQRVPFLRISDCDLSWDIMSYQGGTMRYIICLMRQPGHYQGPKWLVTAHLGHFIFQFCGSININHLDPYPPGLTFSELGIIGKRHHLVKHPSSCRSILRPRLPPPCLASESFCWGHTNFRSSMKIHASIRPQAKRGADADS